MSADTPSRRDPPPPDAVDPAWDPQTRRQVTDAVAALYRVMETVLARRRDPDTGAYRPNTGEYARGDLTGIGADILLQVVGPVQAALDEVTGRIGAAIDARDAYRRRAYGPGWNPDRGRWPPANRARQPWETGGGGG
jgi:hypothetical protein